MLSILPVGFEPVTRGYGVEISLDYTQAKNAKTPALTFAFTSLSLRLRHYILHSVLTSTKDQGRLTETFRM